MKYVSGFLYVLATGLSALGANPLTSAEEYSVTGVGSSGNIVAFQSSSFSPPIPVCGQFINSITYGPVTNATVQDPQCTDTQTAQIYRAYTHYKKKRLYSNGNTWICYDQDPGICHTYHREECPPDTCAGVE